MNKCKCVCCDHEYEKLKQENARLREFIKSQMNKCEHTGYGIKNCSYCIQFKKALEASV